MLTPPTLHRTTVRVALAVLAAVAALTVAELTSDGFREFTSGHALVSTFITEGVLLVGVYLVIDEIIGRREARRWSDVTSLGIRALSAPAHKPAEIVRSAVGELVSKTESVRPGSRVDGGAALAGDAVDYRELVSVHADELGDWLRADETRARLFAEETRQSASRLEEAIIRWGPTLVEDPHSAELLNLLPDVVDSSRFAAQAIAPASRWADRARGEAETGPAGGWTEDDRTRFRDSLLEILKNVDEFDRRLSS